MEDKRSCWTPSNFGRHDSFYKTIGISLLNAEKSMFETGDVSEAHKQFRISSSTVPVEVLESYLEDLLSLNVSDVSLSIHTGKVSLASIEMNILFPFAALLIFLVYSLQERFAFSWNYVLCLIALVAVFLLYAAPRSKTKRRFMFAQILSREISRRRGQGDSDFNSTSSGKSILESIFDWKKGTSQGAARKIHGASRTIFH
ncbi:MAG: hypothetical protein KDD56_00380 [Bdellovibrionales bacterium]|nr:hypothetical protein [Bdellovibrionales bacterium]